MASNGDRRRRSEVSLSGQEENVQPSGRIASRHLDEEQRGVQGASTADVVLEEGRRQSGDPPSWKRDRAASRKL